MEDEKECYTTYELIDLLYLRIHCLEKKFEDIETKNEDLNRILVILWLIILGIITFLIITTC